MNIPRQSLSYIILSPIIVFIILAGAGLYFLILNSVDKFANRNIQQNLQSMASSIYGIADRSVDQLARKGLTGNKKAARISQVSALLEIEDFIRKNEIGILITTAQGGNVVLQDGVPQDIHNHIRKNNNNISFRTSNPQDETFYYHAFDFSPWEWNIVIIKNASDYASLVENVRYFYIIATLQLLLVAVLIIGYLRRVISRPIRHIVDSFREHRKPQYRGIREFEFLSDSVGEVIQEIDETRSHLEELVRARTAELEETHRYVVQKNKALEALSSKLSKYLAPQVYDSIFSGAQDVELSSTRKKLTVMFSDIVGFTTATDKMQSEELTRLLNHYLTEMSELALSYGATIDKYIGDAIMIFFGDPESRGVKEDALACAKMAIAMRERLLELNNEWRESGIETPLSCRVGIHTGYCTVGNFGSENRMDYTIIGGAVNRASRLEHEAPPGGILVSYETYALIRDTVLCEEQDKIQVRGIAYPIATYSVVDLFEKLEKREDHIRTELPHLKIDVDLLRMPADEKRKAAGILRDTLGRLSKSEPKAVPSCSDNGG